MYIFIITIQCEKCALFVQWKANQEKEVQTYVYTI